MFSGDEDVQKVLQQLSDDREHADRDVPNLIKEMARVSIVEVGHNKFANPIIVKQTLKK